MKSEQVKIEISRKFKRKIEYKNRLICKLNVVIILFIYRNRNRNGVYYLIVYTELL